MLHKAKRDVFYVAKKCVTFMGITLMAHHNIHETTVSECILSDEHMLGKGICNMLHVWSPGAKIVQLVGGAQITKCFVECMWAFH